MGSRRRGKRFWSQGEPFVWASGAALAAVLALTGVLIWVILSNGLGVFWPAAVAQVELSDGQVVLGQWMREATNSDTAVRSVQLKTGNRDLDSQRQDFHWFELDAIRQRTYPPEVYVLERVEHGNLYGLLDGLKTPQLELPASRSHASRGNASVSTLRVASPRTQSVRDLRSHAERGNEVPASADLSQRFRAALAEVRQRRSAEIEPLAARLSTLNYQLQDLRKTILKAEYRQQQAGRSLPEIATRVAELRERERRLMQESDRLVADKQTREAALREQGATFRVGAGTLHTVALADIVRSYQPNSMGLLSKLGHYASKVWELLASEPRESNTEGGLFPAIFGTVMLVFLMAVSCFPLGVLAGVYLGEYAREGWLVRLVRIAVNNLAGIPSIVYGIFGLGFFVYGLGGLLDHWLYPERVAANISTFGTGGVLWASLTLGLLTIPVVIVSTEEALRTIPRVFRESSHALGATKLQTLLRVLLPIASPGIMTGFILAMARAAGEVAPLMITGVVKLAPTLPVDGQAPFFHPDRKFMHLGFHIFDIAFQSPNVEATKPMVFVTTTLLVLIVLTMSSVAIYLRNSLRKRFSSRAM
ncbi:MAG: phosphate ABC transporter permease PstA [Planctomycetota bacterium]|nr:phosphate ABC transporter permease PstA [Planctomycetota bacterium]